MFLVFGDKHRTEPVPDGLRREMHCPACGRIESFHERVVSRQFRMYFVDMFTHGSHRVMACDGCGEAYVTDELKDQAADNDHSGTVLGQVQDAVEGVGEAIRSGAVRDALTDATNEAGDALKQAQQKFGPKLAKFWDKHRPK